VCVRPHWLIVLYMMANIVYKEINPCVGSTATVTVFKSFLVV
jgi:hypothetical protein